MVATDRTLTPDQVKEWFPDFTTLFASLPDPQFDDSVVAAIDDYDLRSTRRFEIEGMIFVVPPSVHLPGLRCEMIVDYLKKRDLTGKSVVVMGGGCGVEAVVAGLHGATQLFSIDINPVSTMATSINYNRLVTATKERAPRCTAITSDLFENAPITAADCIVFNPPDIHAMVSADHDMIRNVCVGTSIVLDFLQEIVRKNLVSPYGEVIMPLSSTSESRKIVSAALRLGYRPALIDSRNHPQRRDSVTRFLLRFIR